MIVFLEVSEESFGREYYKIRIVMKKMVLYAVILFSGLYTASAQDYEPTSTWPYLYPDFTAGILHISSSEEREGLYNIHILEGHLHFIEGDLVKEANPADVYSVKIGNDIYINAGGKMMKVLAKSDSGSVVQEILVDKAKLNAAGAAYGASSNSMATRNLSSLEQAGSMVNTNHMELKNSKNEGQILPLAVKIYLMTGGKTIYASRKDVSKETGEEKLKVFLKEHKIRWKDPQSLLQVVDFIAQETTEK